jgi:hypothetical protein
MGSRLLNERVVWESLPRRILGHMSDSCRYHHRPSPAREPLQLRRPWKHLEGLCSCSGLEDVCSALATAGAPVLCLGRWS